MEMQKYVVVENKRTIRRLIAHYGILPVEARGRFAIPKDLAQEIWEHPLNAPLRAVPNRETVKELDSDNQVPLLAPDEWVYMPVAAPAAVQWDYFNITSEKTLDEVCKKINEHLKATTHRPWPHALDPETLYNISVNTRLRRENPDALTKGSISKTPRVFYYKVPKTVQNIPAAPAGSNKVTALPDWLPKIWHTIDRMRDLVSQLEAKQEILADIRAHGAMVYSASNGLHGFLKILKAHTGSSVDAFMAKLQDFSTGLHDKVMMDLKIPLATEAEALADKLSSLQFDAQVLADLVKLKEHPERYPMTVMALNAISIRLIGAFLGTTKGNPLVDQFDKLINKQKTGSYWDTLFALNKAFVDGPGAVLGNTLGNSPGPMSLAVCAVRASVLSHLPKNRRVSAPTLERYARFLAFHFGFDAAGAAELVKAAQAPREYLGPMAIKIKAAELKAAATQSSNRWMAGVGILNLLALMAAIIQFKGDLEDEASRLTLAGDVAGILCSSIGAGAALIQVLENLDVHWKFLPSSFTVSWVMSVAGLITGAITIWQGYAEKDAIKKWSGLGSVLVSSGCILDMLVARFGAQIAIRFALAVGAEALGAEAAILAVGATFATALTVVGILIVIGTIVVANWPAIKDFMTTTGPQRFVNFYMEAIPKDARFGTFPAEVRTLFTSVKAAVDASRFSDFWLKDILEVEKKLKALHLQEQEIKVITTRSGLMNLIDNPQNQYAPLGMGMGVRGF